MREGCDVMAGAPGHLVPVNFWVALEVGEDSWEREWAILWTVPMVVKGKVGGKGEAGCVCANL